MTTLRILVLGNSPHFSHTLSTFLTNSLSIPSTSTVRLYRRLVRYEIILGEGEGGAAGVWALQAAACDGIIYALVSNDQQGGWICSMDPPTFLSTLHTVSPSFPPQLPSILVSPQLQFNLAGVKRSLEVDPATGENCHLALMSLVYWIKQNKK